MQSRRIFFLNKSDCTLQVEYRRRNDIVARTINVKNIKVLKLPPEDYEMMLYYTCKSLSIKFLSSCELSFEDIAVPGDPLKKGVKFSLQSPGKNIGVFTKETVSVSEIISKSMYTG